MLVVVPSAARGLLPDDSEYHPLRCARRPLNIDVAAHAATDKESP